MKATCFVKFFVSVFLMQTLMAWFAVAITNISTDQAALLALKSHISGGTLASNWSTTASVCNWIGVTCGARHHRVITLDLSDMGIQGTIPSEIGNLSFLVFLSVRNNNFYSFLPIELAQLFRLKHLDVGFNFFNGSIPPSLGSLPRLQSLVLEANSFTGDFPLSLCNISSLQRVNASQNQLSGVMHSNSLSLCSLEIIDLSFNNLSAGLSNDFFNHFPKLQGIYLTRSLLSGSIPVSIGNCTLIKEIDFSENKLTGPIPAEIGELANLEILKTHDNDLSGNIPPTLFNISKLKAILMSANCLTGNLPFTMGLFLPNLVELRLSSNKLEGALPTYISNASMLTFVELSNNSFTGSIPGTLGNLRHLQLLMLDKNNFTSESSTPESSFLSSLTNCPQLRRIDLSGISFDATLPNSIGNLTTSLQQLRADNCNIKGNIPREIGYLINLWALSLSNNQLTGTIPATIERLKKLERLHLQGNKLTGNIKYGLCYMDRLFDLSLGGNLLSGSIPDCLGNLTMLSYLNLSSNHLTSSMPSSLCRLNKILVINMSANFLSGSLVDWNFLNGSLEGCLLPVVEEIDLSKNLLSGGIPVSFTVGPEMTYLSLAKNRLRGLLPEYLSLNLEFLDLSCNNLSGPIPKNLEKLRYLKYFNVSFNALEGEIPTGGPFTNFSAQSFMKNYALCGPPRLQVPACEPDSPQRQPDFPCEPDFPQRQPDFPQRRKHNLLILFILGALIFIFLWLWLRCRKSSFSLRAPTMTKKIKRFSYEELEQATDGFSGANLLGTGHFGSVYRGTLQDGKIIAIKVFKIDEERSLRSFDVESKVMLCTGHRNLIRLLRNCSFGNFKALVMEYMVNGSLENWLYTHNYHLDMLQRLDIMIDVASAVKYLHCDYSRPIVHCDLKPSNILLDEDMIARVCDFSISTFLDPGQQDPVRQNNFMCTIGYVAPECGLYGIVSTKTDVFSFGIMLMETFTRKRPTDEMFGGEMNLRRWVLESLPHEVNKVVDPSLLQTEEHFIPKMVCLSYLMRLAQGCTAESPMDRYDMEQVVTIIHKIKEVYLRNIYGC